MARLTLSTVQAKVIALLRERVDADTVATLERDVEGSLETVGIPSLTTVETICDLEAAFGMTIPNRELSSGLLRSFRRFSLYVLAKANDPQRRMRARPRVRRPKRLPIVLVNSQSPKPTEAA